jgi:hypothetical protein
MDMSAAGMLRASEHRSETASWAVLTVLPPGVFITMMPYLRRNSALQCLVLITCTHIVNLLGGLLHINIVHPNTSSADDANVLGFLDHGWCHLIESSNRC